MGRNGESTSTHTHRRPRRSGASKGRVLHGVVVRLPDVSPQLIREALGRPAARAVRHNGYIWHVAANCGRAKPRCHAAAQYVFRDHPAPARLRNNAE